MATIARCFEHDDCWNLWHKEKIILEHETYQVVNNVADCLNNPGQREDSEAQEVADEISPDGDQIRVDVY